MKKTLLLCLIAGSAAFLAPSDFAQVATPGTGVAGMNVDQVVELSLLTQTEVADKISKGYMVFLPAGGTEIRGPHAIIGVHNVLATHRAIEAAKRLGNVIVAPTIPFAVQATGSYSANSWKNFAENNGPAAPQPGAMQVSSETFKGLEQGAVESMMYMGFKKIFLMGDHGGGQNEMKQVADEMTAKFAAKGIDVYYVPDFYQKTHDDIDMYMFSHRLPIAGHGGMMETAEMMYWEPSQFAYVRPIYKTVPFDGPRFEGASLDSDLAAWKSQKDGGPRVPPTPQTQPRANNGLSGNPHFATKEIGHDLAEIGITNTVNQVKALLAAH